jgi:putative hydrolase of the HAD superfamily
MKYKHIFFDLDHTLYDFDRSTYDTFMELHKKYKLDAKEVLPFEAFFKRYQEINIGLWEQYRLGNIEKEVLNVKRFHLTLLEYGIDDWDMSEKFANEYLDLAPRKKCLFPGVYETLDYLIEKYELHLITNGFEEVQEKKIDSNGLRQYFKTITTSEEAGVKKPEPGIFKLALSKANAKTDESIMIGDNIEVDIDGARNFGMDQMLFNNDGKTHNGKITFEVRAINEIMQIL